MYFGMLVGKLTSRFSTIIVGEVTTWSRPGQGPSQDRRRRGTTAQLVGREGSMVRYRGRLASYGRTYTTYLRVHVRKGSEIDRLRGLIQAGTAWSSY